MGIFDTPSPTYANLASSSQTSFAPWYENAAQGAYSGLAGAVANANAKAGQAYDGPGGVALTPSLEQDQLDAFGKVRGNAGTWQPGFSQAGTMLNSAQQRIGQQYTPNGIATGQWGQQTDVDRYMNPYIQNVLDVGARKLNTNFDIQQTKANDQATMSGAFGGSRHGVLQGQIEKNRGEAVSDLYTTGLANAYQNSQGMFTSDQGRGLTAQTADEAAKARAAALGLQAGQLGLQGTQIAQGLGTATSQMGYNDANAQLGIGNFLYDRQQQSINNTYNDWLRQQQQPISNYTSLLQGLGAARTGQSTTGTSQQAIPGVSTASQIGGLATTALGGLGLLNQSGLLKGLGSGISSLGSSFAQGISGLTNSNIGGFDWGQVANIGGDGSVVYPFARGGRVQRHGLGFARGGLVEGIRRYAMGGTVVPQQISKPGIMHFAEGGSLDEAYMGESAPIDWQQESASEFEGQPVGPTMERLQRVFDNAAARGDNERARAVANIQKTLYPMRKQFGDNYIIGTDPRTQQVDDPRPTVQQVLGTGQTFGGNQFGGYRTDGPREPAPSITEIYPGGERHGGNQFGGYRPDIVDPMAGVGGGREPRYETPPKTGIAPAGPPTSPSSIVPSEVPYGLPGSAAFGDLKKWLMEPAGLKRGPQALGDSAPSGIAAAAPANPDGAAVAGYGAERQPASMAGPVDPNTPDDEAVPLPEAKPQMGGAPAPRRTGSMAGGAGPRPVPAPAPSGVQTIGPEGGGAYPPGGLVEAPTQKGLGAFAGPSTPAQAPAAEKPFEPLKSGWMPVIQAGLRMMAAKPGQSFVQNLGEAGEAGIKGLEAQVKAAAEEKKLANEGRKVDLSEREVKVKEGLLPAQQRLYQSHADYYNQQVKAGKMTAIGIDKETGDALFYNTKTDQIESVPGVTTPAAYTAKMTKEMALTQARMQAGVASADRAARLEETRLHNRALEANQTAIREQRAEDSWRTTMRDAEKAIAENPMGMTLQGIERDIEIYKKARDMEARNPNGELAKKRLEKRIDDFADARLKALETAKLSPKEKEIAKTNLNKQREARKYALGE